MNELSIHVLRFDSDINLWAGIGIRESLAPHPIKSDSAPKLFGSYLRVPDRFDLCDDLKLGQIFWPILSKPTNDALVG
jgi:hypothetical protein